MLVLHTSWVKGRCLLWGETMPAPDAAPGRESGKARCSPFDAGKLNLGAAVAVLAHSNYRARAAHARRVRALLPTFGGVPVPSRTGLLPLGWPEAPADARPEEWEVTALPLSYPEFATLLSLCARAENPFEFLSRRIAVGRDVIALADLWRFAGAVAARQTVVPAIRDGRSRWIALLDRADARRLANLADAVPPAASCLAGAEPHGTFARRFFDDAVDLLVREAVTTTLTRLHAARGAFADVHSAWLASLRSHNPAIRWKSAADIAEFAAVLDDWRSPMATSEASSVRLGFRVADPLNPTAETPVWRLTPVIVGGERAVALSERALSALPPRDRESLLLALGQASVLCPLLAQDAAGTGGAIPLDASEVGLFLRETAPLLKAAGYGVFSPAWWTPARASAGGGETDGTRLRIRAVSARFPSEGQGFFSLDALVDVKWEIVLGDAHLAEADVEKILAGGKTLVRWHSRWIYADRARLAGAVERLKELNAGPVTARRLVHLAAGGFLSADGSLEVDLSRLERHASFSRLVGSLRKGTAVEPVAPPADFHGELRPYQARGLSWLAFLAHWGFGACLADDMGLGKTIEAIALFLHVRQGGWRKPVLVVCPMSIMTKWQRELARFAPGLKTWIFHGPGRPTGAAFARQAAAADITITSYQLLCRDFASVNSVSWGIALVDEAQNIKNADTRKSRAARQLSADWRLALTGTPVENGVGDLWAIMDFLNPGLLPGRSRFNEAFLRPIQMGTDPAARETLRRVTGPFILRRLKTDPDIVADLPPRIEEKVYCPLTPEQAELYAAETKDLSRLLASSAGATRRGNVLGLLTRLKQICNHPEHYFSREAPPAEEGAADPIPAARSGKLRRFDELLDDVLAAGECALVFTQYVVMGRLLQRHLRARLGQDVPFLHGGTRLRDRDAMVARFQRPDGPPVFIVSIKAGGTGLDLTRANHVFHFDRWWNPAVENQATDRAHRIGQTRTVFVHTLICEGTLESRIDDLITGKTELARQIVGSGDSWLAGLSDDKLREILALSSSATDYAEETE